MILSSTFPSHYLNSKTIKKISTTNLLKDIENKVGGNNNVFLVFYLAGDSYSANDLPGTASYKYGVAIVLARYYSSVSVILIPESNNSKVAINNRISSGWTGWKDFAGNILK